MTRATESRLEEQVKAYKRDGFTFKIWTDDLGWEEWMLEYCEDAQSEDDALSEADVNAIDDVLRDIWENVTVEAIYDTFGREFVELNDRPITECTDEVKEAIKRAYFENNDERDFSECLDWLSRASDLDDICDVLNFNEFGCSNEKRYIRKEV